MAKPPPWAQKLAGLAALFAVLSALPFMVSLYRLDILIFLLINVIVVVSYRLITTTGEWSLGHVVMMGVGGYASALLAKKLGLSFWLAAPLGAVATGLVAFILSFPLFRMKGFYFLIGSFAAGEAIRLTWTRFRDPFGGPGGLVYIPSPEITLPGLGTIDFALPIPFYFLTLVVVAVSLWLMYRVEKSRIGLTLHAIHWQDVLAESVGIDIWRYKTLAFCTASFFVGLAGALLGHYLTTVNPSQFALGAMLFVLVWVIVGGTGTFAGPIIGVTVLTIVDEVLRQLEDELQVIVTIVMENWLGLDIGTLNMAVQRPLIYGVILILTVRFLPTGLESLPVKVRSLFERRKERAS